MAEFTLHTASPSLSPSGLSRRAIGEYAERTGTHHEIYENGPADIALLLAKLGGTLTYTGEGTSLRIDQEKGTFTINLPISTSPNIDRLLTASLLGHLFLHYLLPQSQGNENPPRTINTKGIPVSVLMESRYFAYALLVPPNLAGTLLFLGKDNTEAVAKHFNVPRDWVLFALSTVRGLPV